MQVHLQQNKKQSMKARTQSDPFRKSQLKESEIVMGGICCSRHLQCIHKQGIKSPYVQSDSISVKSDLLKEVSPQQVDTQPWFQYQTKPEIEMLAQVNIKKKQYQKLIEQYEKEQKEQQKRKMMQKVKQDAKRALSKSKKVQKPHSKDWGHSVFTYNQQNEQDNENKPKQKVENKQPVQKKIQLKPINQRIAEYKQQQLKKIKSAENLHRKMRQDVNLQECKEKIEHNAEKILEEMRKQKQKRQEERRIVQAKIRAIQIKSLKNIQNCKKKPLQNDIQFNLGDSQYSTFDARAQNRKMLKKQKKPKNPPTVNQNLLQTVKSKNSKYSSKASKTKNQATKKKQIENAQQAKVIDGQKQNEHKNVEVVKGPFFIWNIPITVQDQEKLQKKSTDVFMNVDRFNYKQGKTFREEANEFLAKKMEKKMQQAVQQRKYQTFLDKVAEKKEMLIQQYKKEQNKIMSQVFWNQDQVFRANILQNFHFHSKQNSK